MELDERHADEEPRIRPMLGSVAMRESDFRALYWEMAVFC
jgi:hypothetical protein